MTVFLNILEVSLTQIAASVSWCFTLILPKAFSQQMYFNFVNKKNVVFWALFLNGSVMLLLIETGKRMQYAWNSVSTEMDFSLWYKYVPCTLFVSEAYVCKWTPYTCCLPTRGDKKQCICLQSRNNAYTKYVYREG